MIKRVYELLHYTAVLAFYRGNIGETGLTSHLQYITAQITSFISIFAKARCQFSEINLFFNINLYEL